MKLLATLILVFVALPCLAQSLAGSVGLFVYPPDDKTADERGQDDYQCFAWAKDETGFDPMNEREPEQVVSDGAPAAGSGAQGALRGAARGALLGEVIDDDAGKGAAIGAALGGMRARRKSSQMAQQQAASENYQNQAGFQQEQGNFKKAMSLCLESRGYAVK